MQYEVVIWDLPENCDIKKSKIINLYGYSENDNGVSIPKYIEKNRKSLRNEYIRIIHRFGEQKYGKHTLIEKLNILPGFSYWWMTMIAEKSPYKTKDIFNILKMISLDTVLKKFQKKTILLVSNNKKNINLIRQIAKKNNIILKEEYNPNKQYTLKSLYYHLPIIVQGLISIRHIIKKIQFGISKQKKWYDKESVFICDYFFNINAKHINEKTYQSSQLGNLPKIIKDNNLNLNWLHIYTPTPSTPSIKNSNLYITELNKQE